MHIWMAEKDVLTYWLAISVTFWCSHFLHPLLKSVTFHDACCENIGAGDILPEIHLGSARSPNPPDNYLRSSLSSAKKTFNLLNVDFLSSLSLQPWGWGLTGEPTHLCLLRLFLLESSADCSDFDSVPLAWLACGLPLSFSSRRTHSPPPHPACPLKPKPTCTEKNAKNTKHTKHYITFSRQMTFSH